MRALAVRLSRNMDAQGWHWSSVLGAVVRRALYRDVRLSREVKVIICGLPHALVPKVSKWSSVSAFLPWVNRSTPEVVAN